MLARDLKATQAIYPPTAKPVGMCKGQRVYLRANVRELRTEQAWFRRGFDVLPNEAPAKVAHKAAGKAKASSTAAAEEEANKALLGGEGAMAGEGAVTEAGPEAGGGGLLGLGAYGSDSDSE